jgi:eukaryotic-like serine/threonine-protein kinase
MLTSGDVIDNRYIVEDKLGSGGFGTVLKCLDSETDTHVALKYLSNTDKDSKKRFAREVRLMESIKHENVMPIFEYNLEHKPPFFVMPLAQNIFSNNELLKREEDILYAFECICKGILAIHNAGATHRDINPNNILIINEVFAVSDLGLGKFENRDTTVLTQSYMMVGTEAYAAPEQYDVGGSRDADARTDIFQLGKTLYTLITKRPPVVLDFKLLPRGISYIVRKCTNQNPELRYQSVGHLLDAVNTYRKSKDPRHNPVQAFENCLSQTKAMLDNSNEFDSDNLIELMSYFLMLDDEILIMDSFDNIPQVLLPILSKMELEFLPVLEHYSNAIAGSVGLKGFAYAETVGKKMKRLFDTSSTEIKVFALKNVLIASVTLNRFAAMDIFDELLLKINDEEDAFAVSDMLRVNSFEYKKLAGRIPSNRLHTIVQEVQTEFIS